jgi:hypothetical protein
MPGRGRISVLTGGWPAERRDGTPVNDLGGLRLGRGPGEAAGHGDDHGPVDAGLVVSGQPLVVADGAAVAGDPGQGALDDPPAGQDLEGVQVIGPFDDFQGQLRLEPGPSPGDELAGVAAVGPGQPDREEGPAQVPQQRLRGVAVLDGRGGDQDGEQQAEGVDGEMALGPVDLLARVVAAA